MSSSFSSRHSSSAIAADHDRHNNSSPAIVGSSSASSFVSHQDHGKPFIEMLKENEKYGLVFKSPVRYKVKLIHGTLRNLHWFLLVKMKKSKLPYVTIEITTSNWSDLIPITRTISLSGKKIGAMFSRSPETVGTYDNSLEGLCDLADNVVKDMKSYHILLRNCQHFCNNLLQKMGFKVFPTTVVPKTTAAEIKDIEREAEDKNCDLLTRVIESTPARVREFGASLVVSAVGAPSVKKELGSPDQSAATDT